MDSRSKNDISSNSSKSFNLRDYSYIWTRRILLFFSIAIAFSFSVFIALILRMKRTVIQSKDQKVFLGLHEIANNIS